MSWDFSTDPEFEEKLRWMRAFVRGEVFPLEVLDVDNETFMRIVRSLQDEVKKRGLWAARLPPDLGGQGYGQVKLALMHELLGTCMLAPTVFGNQAPDSGNSEILALAGTPEQKERFLEPLLAGELRSAFSMTEPDSAGSDPTLLRTRAERDDDGWVINGHKWFSSNASVADFLIVMAVTDPDAHPYQRASMFIVPTDAPGVRILRERAVSRHAFGGPLADKQTVQNWVADSLAQMQAARLMTLHGAWKMDDEGASAARTEIALIKFFGASVLHDVVDRALQVHGALGYSTDLPLEQMYRYARAARLYDGPDEVH